MEEALIDWSRAQFALTAMYHWLFVPLTLGLSFIIAFMETRYVRTGDEQWKRTTKFWMRLFGVNFAVGVATGLILEFEFGTNWSNYSYFVGDIFGAPLAIEGIMAFFLESTFIAVMFFGWNRVSKRFHLTATWLTAIGASLSALWILVANAWMQWPVGTEFNPATARNEMTDFWAVLFSPVAMNKFAHTVTSGFVLAGVFVTGVSAWFLLRKREREMALRSMKIAALFGLAGCVLVIWTGDGSARQVADKQPAKLAAMEGLEKGSEGAALTIAGPLKVPKLLSIMSFHDASAFVAGSEDLIHGNTAQGILSASEKMERGRHAIAMFSLYRSTDSPAVRDSVAGLFDRSSAAGQEFHKEYGQHFGYGYLAAPEEIIPPMQPLIFWSFRLMVGLGLWFMLMFVLVLWAGRQCKAVGGLLPLERWRWLLYASLWSIPLAYIASQAGWIVAEVGRQPWTIQGLLPVGVSVSSAPSASVQTTFWLFAVLFTVLLAAEVSIMVKQIRKGGGE